MLEGMRCWIWTVVLLGGCLGAPEGGEVAGVGSEGLLVIDPEGQVVVRGVGLELETPREAELVRAYLRRWRSEHRGEELVVWARPGAPGEVLVALAREIEEAGIEAYRMAKGALPPRVEDADGAGSERSR